MPIRLSTYHSKYAEEFIKSNRHLYNPAKHIININKVDWDDFAYKGVDLYEIDKDMMDDLLSGRLTNIIQLRYRDVKLRIYKDEHGKLTNIIIPANSECYIPDKIFNYTLSAEEKECLRSKGRLDKSIQVVVEQSKQVILPFIDEETNQVMHRCMNQVKIPKEFKGVKLTTEHIKNLIGGGDIYIVIDKTMERVFIDPKTGKLISEIEEPLPF